MEKLITICEWAIKIVVIVFLLFRDTKLSIQNNEGYILYYLTCWQNYAIVLESE